jgi:hypothetical protein
VWDLLHFGWPPHVNLFDTSWLNSFEEFAAAFARFLRQETSDQAFVAPVNEISFLAWAGGDTATLNPFAINRGPELKRQLVQGFLRASDAMRTELNDVRFISPEPVIHIVGNPKNPKDVLEAAQYRSAMFEAWDMLAGRALPELGGAASYLDILGLNYYSKNQWWNFGATITRHEPEYRPFREVIAEVYQRYGRPLFIAETGTEDQDRPDWLRYIAAEARAAMDHGVPLHGICLYPILNHPGWEDDRHCHNGLWDYPAPDGSRQIYRPLADELGRQKQMERGYYDTADDNSTESGQTRSTLSLPPTLELRVPASSALDESVRTGAQSILLGGASV